MNAAANEILSKLNHKVGIANKVTKHLTKLNNQAINISMIKTSMLETIVNDVYEKCVSTGKDNAVDNLNIDLMVHNAIITVVFDSLRGKVGEAADLDDILRELFTDNAKHIGDLRIALTKHMWSKQRVELDDIFRVIYTEGFNTTYLNCFYAYEFSYEETTFPPHTIVRMMNNYIVDLFILEQLFRTDMKFKFPFETVHITQDNVKKHGLDLIELLKQKGV